MSFGNLGNTNWALGIMLEIQTREKILVAISFNTANTNKFYTQKYKNINKKQKQKRKLQDVGRSTQSSTSYGRCGRYFGYGATPYGIFYIALI